jgi:monofunctional biosynthetic peptidoglycan transglycosylase
VKARLVKARLVKARLVKDGAALVDETAHAGAPPPTDPNDPAKGDSDLPQPPRSASEPPGGDAAPQAPPLSAGPPVEPAEPAVEPADPTPEPPVESAPAEPIAAAPGPSAEAEPSRTPATPLPSTALPAAGEAEAAEAAPEPVRYEPLPPEPQPVAAGVPEIRVQPAIEAAPPAPLAAAAVAWTPSIPAAPAQPLSEPVAPLAPAWLPQSGWTASAARERLPDLGRTVPYLRLALRGVAILAAGLAVTVLTLVVAYRWINPPLSTLMLGQSLAGIEIERRWVPLKRISPHLVRAVVLSEDGGFCRHSGVDWAAIEQAIEADRGGSTITMQVVKNLFLWPSRSYVRKAIEIGLAYLVEALWSKQRIMEIYLNIAEWGDGVFGAEAAARAHFNKPAARLTAEEAALLAVALPNPLERVPGAPSLTADRLAARLLARMRNARADFSCLPLPRAAPGKAPLVSRPRLPL